MDGSGRSWGGQSLIVVMVDGGEVISIHLSMGVVIDGGGQSLMVRALFDGGGGCSWMTVSAREGW